MLRVERATPRSPASAPVRVATLRAITPFLPTIAALVITTMIATIIIPVIPRGDIHDRATRCDRTIDNHRFATRHGWADHHGHGRRTRGRDDGHGPRGVKDWQRQPKIEADGNPCLGGAGQSDGGNHCYQTEQPFWEPMFCFHGRSDEAGRDIFDSTPLIKTVDY